jgi:hypothetical protein
MTPDKDKVQAFDVLVRRGTDTNGSTDSQTALSLSLSLSLSLVLALTL